MLLAFDFARILMRFATFLLSVPTIIALCAARAVAKVLRIFQDLYSQPTGADRGTIWKEHVIVP